MTSKDAESGFAWVLHQQKAPFFRGARAAFDRSGGRAKRRPGEDVARDIAETLSAMANADGGVLIVGIEDDGAVSGADYPEDRMKVLIAAPKTHVRPAVRAQVTQGLLEGKPVILFDVDGSMECHQLSRRAVSIAD